jgi:hypothetical protein
MPCPFRPKCTPSDTIGPGARNGRKTGGTELGGIRTRQEGVSRDSPGQFPSDGPSTASGRCGGLFLARTSAIIIHDTATLALCSRTFHLIPSKGSSRSFIGAYGGRLDLAMRLHHAVSTFDKVARPKTRSPWPAGLAGSSFAEAGAGGRPCGGSVEPFSPARLQGPRPNRPKSPFESACIALCPEPRWPRLATCVSG